MALEDLAIVKVSELKTVLTELKNLKKSINELKTKESLKSYSVQQTAEMIGVSYNTVRKLISEKKLQANYLNDNQKGKCVIPSWSIKNYLNSNKNEHD